MTIVKKAIAKVRTNESGAAGNDYAQTSSVLHSTVCTRDRVIHSSQIYDSAMVGRAGDTPGGTRGLAGALLAALPQGARRAPQVAADAGFPPGADRAAHPAVR